MVTGAWVTLIHFAPQNSLKSNDCSGLEDSDIVDEALVDMVLKKKPLITENRIFRNNKHKTETEIYNN